MKNILNVPRLGIYLFILIAPTLFIFGSAATLVEASVPGTLNERFNLLNQYLGLAPLLRGGLVAETLSPAVTGSVTPSSGTPGVTQFVISGTATPNATVRCTETLPNGSTAVWNYQANSSGSYNSGSFTLQQYGLHTCRLRDMSNGTETTVTYTGIANLTGSVTPASGVINSTLFTISGSATPNATVRCTETRPNGSTAVFNYQVNSSGAYSSGQFTLQQVGQHTCVLRDMTSGQERTVIYTGTAPPLTSSVSPTSGVINSTLFTISGTATPNATVRCTETRPNGSTAVFNYQANSSGAYTSGQFTLQQVGQHTCVLRDMTSGQERTLTYTGTAPPLTGSVSPTSGVINSTLFTISGTATPNATVRCTETRPNGSTAVFNYQANSSGAYTSGQFTVQQVGQHTCVLRDMTSGQETIVTYTGTAPGPLTGSVTPSSGTTGVQLFRITGTATPNATVRCTETRPNGTTGVYNYQANSSGAYDSGQFTLEQIGFHSCLLRDMASGQETTVTYTGTGNFTMSSNAVVRTINAGESATFTITFTSLNGFAGRISPIALNWSSVPNATAFWSSNPVTITSNGTVQATFTIQTAYNTTPGSYGNIRLQGQNGSVTQEVPQIGVNVSPAPAGGQPALKAPWEGRRQISQGNFGSVSHNVCHQRTLLPNQCTWENTYAIDVAMPRGDNVLAPASGRITGYLDSPKRNGRELFLEISGGGGQKYTIVFMHLSKILVFSGNVVQGQVIAKSGASWGGVENNPGAHLHFHMWAGGTGRPDSHTQPMERLILGSTSSNFREYNGATGELNNSVIGQYRWWYSNNVPSSRNPESEVSSKASYEISSPESLGGNHDVADCNSISGWAWDSGFPSSPTEVDIFDGARLIDSVWADEFRTDLVTAGIGNGYHGFRINTPAYLKDGQPHVIRVKYGNTTTEIPNSARSFTCAGPSQPNPQYEGYFDEANCRKFYGWAWNRNLPDDPIPVDIYDGTTLIASVSANEYREDLAANSIGNGAHAFNYFPPDSLKDGQTHTIHFKYGGTNVELNNSPKLFNSNSCGPVICSFAVGQGTNGSELNAFRNAYSDGGGQPVLGCPTAAVRFDGFTSMNGTISHYQSMANGDVEYHTNGVNAGQAFALVNPFFTRWDQLGYNINNPLGYPISFRSAQDTSCYGTAHKWQEFEGGSLEHQLSGPASGSVFEIHGPIYRKWGIKGYAACPQGEPTGEEYAAPVSGATGSTGRAVNFEGGRIYRKSSVAEAFEVHGSIKDLYVSMGTSGSWLGFPTSDEYVAATGYARNDFEGGYITTLDGSNYQAFHYPASNRKPFDFDGDGKTDISIFRPSVGEWWYLKSSTGGNAAAQFGNSADKLTPGDFTGDGKTDIAFWRPSTGFWYVLRSEDFSFYSFPFGTTGDLPAPADFDGDTKTDAAIFRPSTGVWYIFRSSGGTFIQQFGQNGDAPVASDYDGDGKADLAIWRVSQGEWWIQRSAAGLIAFQFGNSADKAVPGDFTGDGKADVAIWRPSTGFWFVLRSENLSFYSFPFGLGTDIPTPGDFDGDGKFDAAVFRTSDTNWYIQRSTAGTLIQQFGINGDRPVPNAFVP